MKFPTPPEPEKVKSETHKGLKTLPIEPAKVVTTKEREDKEQQPVALSPVALTRLGLTPGSTVWQLLLEREEAGQQTPAP